MDKKSVDVWKYFDLKVVDGGRKEANCKLCLDSYQKLTVMLQFAKGFIQKIYYLLSEYLNIFKTKLKSHR